MSFLSADPTKASVIKPIDALLEFLDGRRGKLLDVGCGEGVLSDTLSQHGYAVTGIDPLVESGIAGMARARKCRRNPSCQQQFRYRSISLVLTPCS